MATVLAFITFFAALAPVIIKVLIMHTENQKAENAKEKVLAKTEVDELDTSITAIDKRLRGD